LLARALSEDQCSITAHAIICALSQDNWTENEEVWIEGHHNIVGSKNARKIEEIVNRLKNLPEGQMLHISIGGNEGHTFVAIKLSSTERYILQSNNHDQARIYPYKNQTLRDWIESGRYRDFDAAIRALKPPNRQFFYLNNASGADFLGMQSRKIRQLPMRSNARNLIER